MSRYPIIISIYYCLFIQPLLYHFPNISLTYCAAHTCLIISLSSQADLLEASEGMCPPSNYQFLHFNINFKDHFIILCIVSFKSKLNGRVMVVPSLSQLLTCGFKSWVLQKMSQSLRTKILRFCNIILSHI